MQRFFQLPTPNLAQPISGALVRTSHEPRQSKTDLVRPLDNQAPLCVLSKELRSDLLVVEISSAETVIRERSDYNNNTIFKGIAIKTCKFA